MSTTENLYEGVGDTIAVLRKRFLTLADNNFCAAFLLDRFVAEIASREEYVMFDGKPMNYRIQESVRYMTAHLLGLFTEQDVVDEQVKRIDKQLIGNHGKLEGSEQYDFEVYRKRINEFSNDYWEKARSQQVHSEVKQQIHPLPIQSPTPEEAQRQREEQAQQERRRLIARELDRVKIHNKRATNASLPATLTLNEWLETLEYFEWKCAYCGDEYSLLEHYIPLSHYAGTTKDNCVPSCHGCNGVKQAWHPDKIPFTTKRNSRKLQSGIIRVKEYLQSIREVGE